MEIRRRLLLLAALIYTAMQPAEGDHHTLASSDLLRVFSQIARPFEDKKVARNEETDRQVGRVIVYMQSILPDLVILHNIAHNVSAVDPQLRANIVDPLRQVKGTLKLTVHKLAACSPIAGQRPSDVVTSPPQRTDDREEEGSLSEEEDNLSEEEDRSESENNQERADQNAARLRDLSGHMELDRSLLTTILEPFPVNSVVTLRAAAETFQNLAFTVAREHEQRFLGLVPDIAQVTETVNRIAEHVTKAKADVEEIDRNAVSFYGSTTTCVKELTRLAEQVVNAVARFC